MRDAIVKVLAAVLLLSAGPAAAFAQDPEKPAEEPRTLDEAATKSLVSKYKSTRDWALKAIILTALGKSFHPCAGEIIKDGLSNRDGRLRAYAVEALRRADRRTFASLATKEIVEILAMKRTRDRGKLFGERVREVLARLAGEQKSYSAWWRTARRKYAPAEWTPPPAPEKKAGSVGYTVAEKFVERAFDLNESGLEVAICIDSTGSMQATIDAARDGLDEIIAMLRGIAPKFRLGLVHYRDYEDFKEGARLLVPLTGEVERVRGALAKLKAQGGGDFPERIEKGLELALRPDKMGWGAKTNKVVIIVGDAPPHPEALDTCVKLARDARENPFGMAKQVATRSKSGKVKLRPFVVSTVMVTAATLTIGATPDAFQAIAKAGGGTYVVFRVPMQMAPGVPAPPVPESDAGKDMVHHLLTLSFGAEWQDSLEAFLTTYQDYTKANSRR